jgi:hypothetical protein
MALSLQPPDSHHLEAAEGWLGLADFAAVNDELKRVAPANRTHPDVLHLRWQIYAQARKWDACLEIATALTKAAPEHPFSRASHAESLHELGRKISVRGKVHQRLNPMNRKALLKVLEPLRVTKCLVVNLSTSRTGHWGEGVTADEMADYCWVKPELLATIKYTEWTEGGVLRHAEFEHVVI